jgi:hypothetical protein
VKKTQLFVSHGISIFLKIQKYISSKVMKLRSWEDWWKASEDDYCGVEASTDQREDGAPVVNGYRKMCDDECLDAPTSSKEQPPTTCFPLRRRRRTKLVLDIRNQDDFDERHWVSTSCLPPPTASSSDDVAALRHECRLVVVHIPHSQLTHRRFELPPRHVPFAILFNPQMAATKQNVSNGVNVSMSFNATTLESDSTGAVTDLFFDHILGLLSGETGITAESNKGEFISNLTLHESGQQQQHARPNRLSCPWNVTAVLRASDETWQQAHESGVSLHRSDLTENEQRRVLFQPEPRLWSPDSMVEYILLPLLTDFFVPHCTGAVDKVWENQRERPVEIWDLGAGVGRDVCFLAEELRAHWSSWRDASHHGLQLPFLVVGLDQRYRDVDKNEAIDFWKRRGVESVTSCRCVDLNTVEMVERLMAANLNVQQSNVPGSIDTDRNQCVVQCFYAVRYWNQPLFAMLVQAGLDRRLRSGTIVAIAQFGKSYAHAPWPFPHPKEKHVLERDELRALFSTALSTTPNVHGAAALPCWNIVHDQVVLDSDHGRTLIQFVAQLQY